MDRRDVTRAAGRANDSTALTTAARAGYAVSGVLHLLIGWIALRVAWGGSGQEASQSGALQSLAENGIGRVLLWVVVAGFVGLALWQLTNAVVPGGGEPRERWMRRAKSVGVALVYLALAWSAFGFARGRGHDSKGRTVDATATLMRAPAGRWLVGLVGLGILVAGGYHVWKGLSRRFLEDLRESPGGWAVPAGIGGYTAKGVALGVVGVLFVVAALQGDPNRSTGLDGALRTLRGQPLGQGLLTVVALGLVAYGLYSFSRARHAKV
jgi:hypothetical protein